MTLQELKEQGEAPPWLLEEGFKTLMSGYLLPNETPKGMYTRVSKAAASNLEKPELEKEFFNAIWNNWICPSTPIATNLGTERGLPISCYGQNISDSITGIFNSYHETAMLTKNGGGIGKYWGKIRARGMPIKGNGYSEGIVPWLKVDEQVTQSVGQGGVRRGSAAHYLDINHGDIEEFLDIRKQTGDLSRRCLSNNFHHAVCIDNDFMNKCISGDVKSRELWTKILKNRIETGEPYIMFKDTANITAPDVFKQQGFKIEASQLCNEIYLPSSEDYTYVCCLLSLNVARYNEWKNTNTVKLAIYLLDSVITEFIKKAYNIPGLQKAVNFAEDFRAVGMGVLGWHSLLQQENIPFDSFEAMQLNAEVFSKLKKESTEATKLLALEYGEPFKCKGFGIRNATLMAVAPTMSNSLISGVLGQGIEPIVANIFAQKLAKGTNIRKNPVLEILLEQKGLNTFDIWEQINKNNGSVQAIKGLSSIEKEVFLTAYEINQHAIIKQAGQRQKFIDQGQSVNLFFPTPATLNVDDKKKLGKYIHEVHLEAWKQGLKGLYYIRSESVLKGDSIYRDASECKACEG